jgi:hypothetical protein
MSKPETTPKPAPGSAESIRLRTAELESATALLKELAEPAIKALGTQSDEEFAGQEAFARAYCRWLRARAALNDPDASFTDEDMAARQNDVDEAALALLVTPVRYDDMVWRKWEVLEDFVSSDARDGHSLDNRAVMALGCIKADLIRIGIGNGGAAQ